MSIKHWGENPVGQWTIRVSDQGAEGQSGYFLGWTMNFFGSTIDASKAEPYLVPSMNRAFPPLGEYGAPLEAASSVQPSSTKQHAKPTDHLPTDHSGSQGDKSKPAFPSATPTATDDGKVDAAEPSSTSSGDAPSDTTTPASDETYPEWVRTISLVVIGVISLGVGGFLWWRRRQQRPMRQNYGPVPNEDDLAMVSLGRGDEENGRQSSALPANESVGYHSGFLDDDDDGSVYKDDPDARGATADGQTNAIAIHSR